MKLKHLFVLGGALLMASCSDMADEGLQLPEEALKIQIDGGIDQQYLSRVNDGGFCGGDQIGLYGVNYTDKNTQPGTLKDEGNQVDNIRYTLDEETGAWQSSTPAYYKDLNTHIDLYAYYPYGTPLSTSAYEFEVAKDQLNNDGYAASDFLWAKAEKVVPSDDKVKLHFTHRLSCANVILKEGAGFGEGEFDALDKSVLAMNTTRSAQINLATGEVTATGTPAQEGILMMQGADGFRAVVVPQTVKAQTALFAITVNGITYRFSKEAAFEYVAGMQSKFTITIDKKEMEGTYEFKLTDTEIVAWEADLETHGGEARQYYVVHMEEPGTLGQLIKADKKNPNKIKNLKISGKVDARDFYFMRDSMEILQAVNMKECTIEACWYWEVYLNDEYQYLYFDGEMPKSESERLDKLYEKYSDILRGNWWQQSCGNQMPNEIPTNAFQNKSSLVYFSFPEKVTKIGASAFSNTLLSGALVIPNDVIEIENNAFTYTNISSLELSHHLKRIGYDAFSNCASMAGTLSLPESLEELGPQAFYNCSMLSGSLFIPSNIKIIPYWCFKGAGFSGDLIIPEGVIRIEDEAFYNCAFNGQLTLPNSLKEIENGAFNRCHFQGELCIPIQIQVISEWCFSYNDFSSIVFPENSEVLKINLGAFSDNRRLTEPVYLPKELISIEANAFNSCNMLPKIIIPATTTTIGQAAFLNCYSLSSLTCEATIPPTLGTGVFDGVAKDNFTLEVPEQSVNRYQTEPGWSDFRRSISAHHDFSISRPLLRTLNATYSKTYTLRAPANQSWSIQKKPEWVTITPESGVGKTDVTVTVNQMPTTTNQFEYTYRNNSGTIKTEKYTGRADSIIFLLNDKDYTTAMRVEQYQSDRYDGEVIVNQSATKGNGVNIVFMGDCFDARDIATGKYLDGINEAIGYYFDIEPYKSYKDYFNIYTVIGMSPDTGMGTVNTIKDAKFGSQYSLDGITPNTAVTYEYAMKAATVDETNLNNTLVVMVENTTDYGGICYMWGDGSAIAICPMSRDAYPYDFRGIVQHEAGGHGFAKLADEYIYHNAFIESCPCICCSHLGDFNKGKALGWYRNLSTNGDMKTVEWAHLIYHPDYSNIVDMYEGGYFHTRGIYRSEATSCMNNNIPYYSAIQRQEMVERIMKYAGLEFSLDAFYAKDVRDASAASRSLYEPWSISTAGAGKQHEPKFMGNKPNLK